MFGHEGSIQISKIANGYLVTVPVEHDMQGYSVINGGLNEQQIRYQTQVMRDELFSEDNILKLAKQQQPTADIKLKVAQMRANEMFYTFDTFTEVLAFLKFHYEEQK